jgi:hypothetical protein
MQAGTAPLFTGEWQTKTIAPMRDFGLLYPDCDEKVNLAPRNATQFNRVFRI